MKKSLIKNTLKFMQSQSYEYRRVHAQLTPFAHERNFGGGANI
ncbi:MAG: hypothetical protein ACLSWI_09005 [Candidatus Gastranaerophilaceae bacterium]